MHTTHDRYLSQTDYLSWRMEADPILRSTIVAVVLLDRDPDWRRFVDTMERGTRRVPLFRRKVVTDPIGVAPPRWVDDPGFDLGWHLRRFVLPPPGEFEQVLDTARILGTAAFDTSRPLWEFTLLGGLDGGRAALVMKVHHCMTDGVGGMQIAREIVDFERDGTARDEPVDVPPSPDGGPFAWYRATAVRLARAAVTMPLTTGTRLLRNPVGAVTRTAATAGSVARYTRPVTATLSPVMTGRGIRRRFAAMDVPFAALDGAAVSAGGSVNDAFLAAVLRGTARYHRAHGAHLARVRATVPMSLRTEADPLGGNRIALARFELPADLVDTAALVRRVHRIVAGWRREPAVALSPAIAGVLNLLPAALLGGMLEHVDVVASNVAGSPVPLYLAGSEMLQTYAFSPTLGSAFNATLLSYRQRCGVGLDIDADAVPDGEVLAEAIADGFRDVLALDPNARDATVRVVR